MKRSKLIFYSLVLVFTISCKKKENNKSQEQAVNSLENVIKTALLNGYYEQVDESISLSFYQDNIYYFSKEKDGFSNKKFLLHLIREDGSFENIDFFKEGHEIDDNLKGFFKDLSIIHRKVNFDNYNQIRVGQFERNSDGTSVNTWMKQISVKDISNRTQSYKNQFLDIVKGNLIQEYFDISLETGVFFEIKEDFYLLFSEEDLYMINKSGNEVKEKIMLHFIRPDGTFNNLSFTFKNKEYQQFLKPALQKMKIAKIKIPQNEEYSNLRIGQYNSNGNLWLQIINFNEIYSNELLTYNNELE